MDGAINLLIVPTMFLSQSSSLSSQALSLFRSTRDSDFAETLCGFESLSFALKLAVSLAPLLAPLFADAPYYVPGGPPRVLRTV